MKRLIRKTSADIRDHVLMTAPVYPSFPGEFDPQFQKSDDKSYSKMMNDHTLKLQKERGMKDEYNGYYSKDM